MGSGDDDSISSELVAESRECADMTTISLHSFGENNNNNGFTIQIIELGAGTSLPGLVAAKVVADVTLTDDANRMEVLRNIQKVCDLNKLSCKVKGLTWGVWDAPIFEMHPQILLVADVLYDTSAFDDLFSTVAFLLERTPGSVFITAYHNRSEIFVVLQG